VEHAQADVGVGGRFRVLLRGPGGTEHDVSGVYRAVVRDEKLVFTWGWRKAPEHESLVTVALRREGAATWLTLTHEPFADEVARDSHRSGWREALAELERFLA
jgi:uncharacterized protein YndB with AHSA1/START domain